MRRFSVTREAEGDLWNQCKISVTKMLLPGIYISLARYKMKYNLPNLILKFLSDSNKAILL